MDVRVEYRLPRCVSAIHANVKTLRLELFLKNFLNLPDEIKGIGVLIGCYLPDRCNVSFWYNERVTVGDRKAV